MIYPSQTPERRSEYNKTYRAKNADKLRAYDAARYKRRLAERTERSRTDGGYRARERARSYRWRVANPGRWKALCKRWRDANPGYISPSTLDKDRANAQWRAAYLRRAEYYRLKALEKRVRRRSVPGTHTSEEWYALVERHQGCCVYCGANDRELTRDHVIPLSRAELSPTNNISNIAPACLSCNSSKKNKTAEEFLAWRER